MKLRAGSLFSGIGGFDLGFERAGFDAAWQVEREPFCQAILKTRFPNTELFDDVRAVGKKNLSKVHVITGGFPCQDLSTAGKRAGLHASRSGLFFEARRIIKEMRPTWFVLENVPGLLSSKEGADFRTVIEALAQCGYGLAWRVLDSQYFGVAQRRRRVFIVGRLGKPCPAEILFECPSSYRHPSPIRTSREGVAAPLTSGSPGHSNAPGRRREDDINLVPSISIQDQPAVAFEPRYYTRDNRTGGAPSAIAHPMRSEDHAGDSSQVVCFEARYTRNGRGAPAAIVPPLKAGSGSTGKGDAAPLVCGPNTLNTERLQRQRQNSFGVDDQMRRTDGASASADANRVRDFASLPEGLDSARYRALGNAVTVSVAYWIAKRIKISDSSRTTCCRLMRR